jgi:hypothetical protein
MSSVLLAAYLEAFYQHASKVGWTTDSRVDWFKRIHRVLGIAAPVVWP